MYPDEIFKYQEYIKQRRAQKYLMLLSIAHNPHNDNPEALAESLRNDAGLPERDYLEDVEPDRDALNRLKGILSGQG